MHKKTLTSLFAESLYQIPDYQRGYAWGEKQSTLSRARSLHNAIRLSPSGRASS